MQYLIDEDAYKKRVSKLTNVFPFKLMIVLFVIVYIYHSIMFTIGVEENAYISLGIFSGTFFHSTLITAVFYVIKSRFLSSTFELKPEQYVTEEVGGYLPCVLDVMPHKHQYGAIVVVNDELKFYAKKADGVSEYCNWGPVNEIEFHEVDEKHNLLLNILFGLKASILIKSPKLQQKILFPMPSETVKELKNFVSKAKLVVHKD
jgi:hypothetical protein